MNNLSLENDSENFKNESYNLDLANQLSQKGYIVLKNAINGQLLREFYNIWEKFFSLNREIKQSYIFDVDTQYGYFPENLEHAKTSSEPDPKEMFHFAFDGVCPEPQQLISQEIFSALFKVAQNVLSVLQEQIPTHVKEKFIASLAEMLDSYNKTLIRILHYPSIDSNNQQNLLCAPHEDIDFLTLLPAATLPGLEIFSQNRWQALNYSDDDVLVMTGEMLQLYTDGFFSATPHQVIKPSTSMNKSRFAVSFFVHPKPFYIIKDQFTAEEIFKMRLAEIGLNNDTY